MSKEGSLIVSALALQQKLGTEYQKARLIAGIILDAAHEAGLIKYADETYDKPKQQGES